MSKKEAKAVKLQPLAALACVAAAMTIGCGSNAEPAQSRVVTTDAKTGRQFVQKCCQVTLDFYVDGKKVSHESMLVFDSKERSIAVDSTEPHWTFVFKVQATADLATVRWDAGIGGDGDAVKISPKAAKMDESIAIEGEGGASQSRFRVVARAKQFGIPLPMPGDMPMPIITSGDPGGTYPPLNQHALPLPTASSPQDASGSTSQH